MEGDHIQIKNQKYVSPDVIKDNPIKEVQTELINKHDGYTIDEYKKEGTGPTDPSVANFKEGDSIIQSDAVYEIKEEVNILKAIEEAMEKKAKEPQLMTPKTP